MAGCRDKGGKLERTQQRLEEAALEDLDDAFDGVAQRLVLRLRQLRVVRLQQLQRSVRVCKNQQIIHLILNKQKT